ncbi:MAG: hypothetical protein MUO87_04420 [Thermoplasmata archaeon]|nr:hypothetical protein [Thermoplasmata archaeon]
MVDLSFLTAEPYPALSLVVGGLLALFLAVFGRRDDSYIDEIGTALAFMLGAFMLVIAVAVMLEGALGWLSIVVLLLLAACLFLKPFKTIPWSGVFGVAAGAASAYLVSTVVRGELFGLEEWKVLVLVFFAVGAVVHLLTRFIGGMLALSAMVLSWKASIVIVGLVAIVEGAILLLRGESLLSFL